ncbi:MAG: restriction endonuclease subunit S [Dokdonella sp.]
MTVAQSQLALNDVCESIVDCEHKTAPTQEEGHPSIRTPNIGRGRLALDGVNRVSDETYKLWTQRMEPRSGDLILAREAPVGNVAIIPKNMKVCLGQRTVLIRPDRRKVFPDYLVYLMLGDEIQGMLRAQSNGATVHHLNMKDIRGLRLPLLPSMEEQRRIASILSAYDDLIENNTRRIAILEEMARRIYEEWFVRFRFPGHENVRMVESEMGPVPEGWVASTLGQTAKYINRGVAPKYDETASGIVINQKCIRGQRLNLAEARCQSKSVSPDKLVRRGDVLINSTGVGTLGRVAQVQKEMKDCTVDTHVSIVRPGSNTDHDFFGIALLSMQPHFEAQGVGSTGQTELSRGRIADTSVLLPSNDLQQCFGGLVGPMRQLAVTLQSKNTNLRTTRDLLLPKLISGELDVSTLPEPEATAA